MSVDGRHRIGLPAASAAMMFGIAFAANPGRFGVPIAIGGLVVAVTSGAAAVWLFRSGAPRGERAGSVDQPEGSENT